MNLRDVAVPQLNINISDDFQQDLEAFMQARGIKTKSEAVKLAIKEAANLARRQQSSDYQSWLGSGLKAELNEPLRLQTEDDLWKVG